MHTYSKLGACLSESLGFSSLQSVSLLSFCSEVGVLGHLCGTIEKHTDIYTYSLISISVVQSTKCE